MNEITTPFTSSTATRSDTDLFRQESEYTTQILTRDMAHSTAAVRAENEIREMAKRDPWASSEEGRRFLERVYAVLDRLQTLPEPSVTAPACLHEDTTTHYDFHTCNTCGGFLADSGWGIAKNKWFKSKAEAEFYKKNGRLPEAMT